MNNQAQKSGDIDIVLNILRNSLQHGIFQQKCISHKKDKDRICEDCQIFHCESCEIHNGHRTSMKIESPIDRKKIDIIFQEINESHDKVLSVSENTKLRVEQIINEKFDNIQSKIEELRNEKLVEFKSMFEEVEKCQSSSFKHLNDSHKNLIELINFNSFLVNPEIVKNNDGIYFNALELIKRTNDIKEKFVNYNAKICESDLKSNNKIKEMQERLDNIINIIEGKTQEIVKNQNDAIQNSGFQGVELDFNEIKQNTKNDDDFAQGSKTVDLKNEIKEENEFSSTDRKLEKASEEKSLILKVIDYHKFISESNEFLNYFKDQTIKIVKSRNLKDKIKNNIEIQFREDCLFTKQGINELNFSNNLVSFLFRLGYFNFLQNNNPLQFSLIEYVDNYPSKYQIRMNSQNRNSTSSIRLNGSERFLSNNQKTPLILINSKGSSKNFMGELSNSENLNSKSQSKIFKKGMSSSLDKRTLQKTSFDFDKISEDNDKIKKRLSDHLINMIISSNVKIRPDSVNIINDFFNNNYNFSKSLMNDLKIKGLLDQILNCDYARPIAGKQEIQVYDVNSAKILRYKVNLNKNEFGCVQFLEGIRHCIAKNVLYIVGGRDWTREFPTCLAFDLEKKTLKRIRDLTYPRSYFTLICNEDQETIYCIGGENNNTVESYNIAINQWSLLPNMNFARANSSACILNKSHLYVFSGYKSNINSNLFEDKIERIDLNEFSRGWEIVEYKNHASLDLKYDFPGILPITNDKIFIYGGEDARLKKKILALFNVTKKEIINADETVINDIRDNLLFQKRRLDFEKENE